MPYCPSCNAQYVQGMTNCSDCGAELVDELSVVPEPPLMDEKLVPVFTAKDEYEAGIVRGILTEAGIPTQETTAVVKSLDPFTVGPLGEEQLRVPESYAESAVKAIEEALAAAREESSDEGEELTG